MMMCVVTLVVVPMVMVTMVLVCVYLVLDDKAGRLRDESKRYQNEARFLNLRASVAAKVAVVVVVFLFLIFLRYFLF